MNIILAENSGFCFGVKRAMKLAFDAANCTNTPIYSLGPLIHNPQQVELLAQKGVHVISNLDQLASGDTLIIRSHGTTPDILEKANVKGINIVDATCPFVINAQRFAQALYKEGYQVVIVGEGDHPEVVGIMGFVENNAWVIENAFEIKNLPKKKRVGIIAQTTQSFDNFREVVCALMEKSEELKVFNTICHATTHRQEAAINIANKVDLMIVIGGRNSANTNRLASLCKLAGVTTYHIETSNELHSSWFESVNTVGVTAGASTPEWLIEDVLNKLKNFGRKNS